MKRTIFYLFLVSTIACTPQKSPKENADESIAASDILRQIQVLASDDFEGRKPFTPGEEKTISYIKDQYTALGLEPANGDSYLQKVPMVEINAGESPKMSMLSNNGPIEFNFRKDFVALTRRVVDSISLENSEVVFAGYGIVAPEYNWNDYEGLDVHGKTVIVLVNDPGFYGNDSTFFKGKAMTYYGRWTYKYEEAARQGAAALLIVHKTDPASYPWGVVETGWSGANLYLNSENNNMDRCAIEGWITSAKAKELFAAVGKQDYDFYQEARKREFTSFGLGITMNASLINTHKTSESNNVAGLLRGATHPDEVIIYSAHWDHLGIGKPVDGDSIWNGAIDNASGIAAMLSIAKAFTTLKEKPARSVLFLAVTAEEQGLLGSEYYATHPLFPPANSVADINIDAFSAYGKMKDFTIVGYGQSEMDDLAKKEAEAQGRYIFPDPNSGKGYFFRSDHFNFAKVGIPALYGSGTYEQAEKGVEYAKEMSEDYEANHYHKPSDEVYDTWDLDGMVDDSRLLFNVGYDLATSELWPSWKPGSEFKAIREQDRKAQ